MTRTEFQNSQSINKFSSTLYTLSHKIGEGGFGQVYKAKNNNTGQAVAIKILTLNPEFDEDKRQRYIERFERETLLGSHLQHPNIVRLLDKGQCDHELIYAVFEYVDGQTLKERLSESGPLPATEAAEIMAQVLDAMTHAHEQGVIHRDIKPANIMLTQVGAKTHAKILDFGIGALTNEVRQLDYKSITLTQETLGTPSYSAPEQLRGEPPSPKTDLYVWGLVFIECLTGMPAVSGSSLASIFQKQLNPANIPLPAPLVGHPVAPLLRRVLNKKLNERAGSALEVYQVFTQLNFSSLVGDIAAPKQEVSDYSSDHAQQTLDQTLAQTQMGSDDFLSSRLTERKQITVMCVTLTMQAIATNGEKPEDIDDTEIIQTLHQDQKAQCVDIAFGYGAFHVGSLGDTLLFYFGYPSASDNDCRLCARTALELLSQLNKRNSLLKLSQGIVSTARIGIHSGIVTVHADNVPEGDIPNIAMELSRLADADQILCSEATRKILESHVEFEAREAVPLGIRTEKVPLFSLVGERMVEAFGFLRANHRHQHFIGREKELAVLESLLLPEANHNCAHVYGEAGIGKSRLVHELRSLANKHTHFVAQCLPEYMNNALYPVFGFLKHRYSLDALDHTDAIERLQSLLDQQDSIDKEQAILVLCAWLNLAIPEDFPAPTLSPDESKQMLFNTLIYLLCRRDETDFCDKNLFIFEDMHWADPISIEFVGAMINDSLFKEKNHAFISTSRETLPESLDSKIGQILKIENLNEQHTIKFISHLFDLQNVSQDVSNLVVSRTDGIPLFIEELVSMLKQKEAVHFVNGAVNFVSQNFLAEIPGSLRDLLQQKMDQLGEAKLTLQLAAAVGRDFGRSLLVECANSSEEQILLDLDKLVKSDLIYPQRKVSGERYIFKHALVKDTAYQSMTVEAKEHAHQKIAETLELMFDNESDDMVGVLSRHFFLSNSFDKAKLYASKAAKSAMEKSAYLQAIHFSKEALTSAQRINCEPEEELEINQLLTTATMMTSGWASPDVERLHEHSKTLLERLDDDQYHSIKFSNYWSLATYYDVRGLHEQTQHFIESALNLEGVSTGDIAALYALKSHTLWMQGRLRETYECAQQSLDNYDFNLHADHAGKFGHDTRVFALSMLSLALFHQGDMEGYKARALEAEQHATKVGSIHSVCMAKYYYCWCLFDQGKYDEATPVANEILEICQKEKLLNWQVVTEILVAGMNNDTESAEKALETILSVGATQMQGYWNSIIIQTDMHHDRLGSASTRLDSSIEQAKNAGDTLFLPKLYALKSLCSRRQNNLEESTLYFEASNKEAEKINLNILELSI